MTRFLGGSKDENKEKRVYRVDITETLQKQVEVEATSENEAHKIVQEGYRAEDYVLDSEDFIGADIFVVDSDEPTEGT
jgi:hypothetical protein